MAAKMFVVVLALAVLTAFVMASEQEDFMADDLYEMVKRGRKGGRRKGKNQYLIENLYTCEDEYGNPGCLCDKTKGGEPVIC